MALFSANNFRLLHPQKYHLEAAPAEQRSGVTPLELSVSGKSKRVENKIKEETRDIGFCCGGTKTVFS
jgi:hypothetical protein